MAPFLGLVSPFIKSGGGHSFMFHSVRLSGQGFHEVFLWTPEFCEQTSLGSVGLGEIEQVSLLQNLPGPLMYQCAP